MRTEVFITSEFITLGQFLKFENLIESGGSVKFFLEEIPVFINNEQDNRVVVNFILEMWFRLKNLVSLSL